MLRVVTSERSINNDARLEILQSWTSVLDSNALIQPPTESCSVPVVSNLSRFSQPNFVSTFTQDCSELQ